MATTHATPTQAPARDFMPLNGIDHVELWVGNAAQAAYFLLGVIEAGGPIEWLEQQFNNIVSFVEGVVETVGGFLDSSPGLSAPSEETLLSWTHTAINVLNYLAVITGLDVLGTIADVLSTLIEVYKMVKLLVDAVTTVVNTIQSAGSAAQADSITATFGRRRRGRRRFHTLTDWSAG